MWKRRIVDNQRIAQQQYVCMLPTQIIKEFTYLNLRIQNTFFDEQLNAYTTQILVMLRRRRYMRRTALTDWHWSPFSFWRSSLVCKLNNYWIVQFSTKMLYSSIYLTTVVTVYKKNAFINCFDIQFKCRVK